MYAKNIIIKAIEPENDYFVERGSDFGTGMNLNISNV
jgi:hypothetical protein